jgi:hypothetical protein
MNLRSAAACLTSLVACTVFAAEEAPTLSANELAARLSAKQQEGASYVRLKMEVKQPPNAVKTALQLQIKSRSTRAGTDLVYQVLWPKERKGESVLLRKSGNRTPTGMLYIPPNAPKPLDAAQMKDGLFGSDLSYEDVIENFFTWDQQAIVGAEVVDRVNCQILESKPGKGERSSYSSVRTWVDTRRLVPLLVEKYGTSGKLVRRIETTRVASDDNNHPVPANLTVRGSRGDSVTELDGSRIRHGVTFSDDEFTPEKLKEVTTPRAGAD